MILALSGKMGSGKNTTANIIQYIIDSKESGFNLSESNYDDYIKNNHHLKCSFKQKSFAGKLKEIVALLTGCTVEDLESQDFKKKLLGPEWQKVTKYKTYDELTHNQKEIVIGVPTYKYLVSEEWIPDYRWLLQTIGTDALRNVVHENIWVNALMADYKSKLTSKQIKRQENRLASDHDVFLGKDTIYHEKRTDKEVDSELKKFINSGYPNWIITDLRFPNEAQAVEKADGITIRVNRDNGTRAIDLNPHPSETALDNHKFDYVIDNDGSLSDLVDKVRAILTLEKVI